MKKWFLMILALVMLLTACGASPSVGDADDPTSSTNAGGNLSPVTAQDYYQYLNEVFIPENLLASNEPIELTIDTMNFHYAWNLTDAGGKGMVSAFIEDFNGDGVLELLTVEINDYSIMNTYYNKVVFEEGANYDPEYRCTVLCARHFDYKDGQITEQAFGLPILMPETSWGKLIVGIEKVDDEYYLFANVGGEHMSTYGPSQFTVTKIGGDSLSPMYSSVLDYGRANASNYLELMGIQNSINIRESTLSDLRIPNYEKDVATHREYLGNRLLCVVDIDYVDFGGDDLVVTITDFTNLRENLQNNGANWEKIQLPQGTHKETPTVPADVEAWINNLTSAAATQLQLNSCETEDGVCQLSYTTTAGNSLSLTWDMEKNQLQWLGLSAYKGTPDEEWISLKDAILDSDILELNEDQKALFYGAINNWTDYMNGIELGMYTISVFSITNAIFSASRIA